MEKCTLTRNTIKDIIDRYINVDIRPVVYDEGHSLLRLIDKKYMDSSFEQADLNNIVSDIIETVELSYPNITDEAINKNFNNDIISLSSIYFNGLMLDNPDNTFIIKCNKDNLGSIFMDIVNYLKNTKIKFHINLLNKTEQGDPKQIKIFTNDQFKDGLANVLTYINLEDRALDIYPYSIKGTKSNKIAYEKSENKITTTNILSKCIVDGIMNAIDEYITNHASITYDETLMNNYHTSPNKYQAVKDLMKFIGDKDSSFYETIIDNVLNKVSEEDALKEYYEVNNEYTKDEAVNTNDEEEFEKIIKIEPPKIVHEEELTKEDTTLTDTERNNLIEESREINKLDKYAGYLTMEEANDEIRPGLTVYDYLESNNVLSIIPLNASIMLDDGVVMSGIDFIKQRVIPGAKYYNQTSVMDTISKYSTSYMNQIEAENIKNGGIFK